MEIGRCLFSFILGPCGRRRLLFFFQGIAALRSLEAHHNKRSERPPNVLLQKKEKGPSAKKSWTSKQEEYVEILRFQHSSLTLKLQVGVPCSLPRQHVSACTGSRLEEIRCRRVAQAGCAELDFGGNTQFAAS